ncbi:MULTISPECIES: flagellin N-terminal helical domain-containing protein [Achromobacter]|uniref:flagellin N-terminal helical domain-containing protein n=1 Tax=Achromobacter TaxID=222 RepID=UPI0003D5A40D|nr:MULTISPECIES: flagellin [Achromobacter]AHC48969.1 Flagellar biosynthesis protein FliC [Achromobacter xylosoxidans NBRC 15126 = ATCC 27061]PWY42401.1 flagellin FliC [Achromobacter sp. RW408]QKQ53265.1 flagellin FliC [Achromobacter xylosoxidans]QPR97589.1 flagellin FliC [Achromobacter xylosoxidans]UON41531.1 flagellin FliC [Achromobacter xylosoxidans]
MAAVINTNYLSLVAQNNLNKSQSALGTAIERLSSGLRINSAKDDAAGMAISNRFTSNVRGLTQASRNANDGISLAQTTEGAASEVTTHLQRVRELTVQAANGSYSQEQLDSIQDEIKQRMADIDRISEQTDFNGVKVLSANAAPLTLQVGANDGETITLNLSEISAKTLGLNGFNINGKGVVDNAVAKVNDMTGPNVAGVAGQPNQYDVTTKNTSASTTDVLSKLTNGNTVIVQGATTADDVTYTYDAAAGNFTYNKNDSATNVATAITSKIGSTPATATYKNSTQEVSIQIASDGKITNAAGAVLFWDTKGNLSETDAGGTWNQATVTTMTTYMGTATTAPGAQLSINGTTYKVPATGTAGIQHNATATTEELVGAVGKMATGKNTTITLGSGVLSATITVNNTGLVQAGGTNLYLDSNQELTKTSKIVQRFEFDQLSSKIQAITGGDTYTTAGTTDTATGVDPNANSLGKQLFINSAGKMTFETTSKGDKTADPLKTLDAAFNVLNKLTGELGAVQNRLESTIANLNNVINNLSGARSRILDADYATEVSNMSRAQILQQAGTSVLAQANQVPQTVLSLLR